MYISQSKETTMRVCSICQKPNHNAATCGKPPKVKPVPNGTRKCGRCNQTGHDIRRCSVNLEEIPEGHRLLLEQKQKVDRIPDKNGVEPHKGLWVVSYSRKKIAGKIIQVKKTGEIVWENMRGAYITSQPSTFKDSDYVYCDLEPNMLKWEVINE